MPGNVDTYVFVVTSSRILVIRGSMMQNIGVLYPKLEKSKNNEEEENEGFLI